MRAAHRLFVESGSRLSSFTSQSTSFRRRGDLSAQPRCPACRRARVEHMWVRLVDPAAFLVRPIVWESRISHTTNFLSFFATTQGLSALAADLQTTCLSKEMSKC